jgi:hypothetical protein
MPLSNFVWCMCSVPILVSVFPRFHELLEFDGDKHSCRRRLAGHNARRRKSSADRHGGGGGDQDGRSHPGNPSRNHFQIR